MIDKDMKENFDFGKIGKRMPYKTPEEFFDDMESNIFKELDMEDTASTDNALSTEPAIAEPAKSVKTKRSYMRVIMRSIVALAAAITLFFVISVNIPKESNPNDYTDVEQAFSNLSTEDQTYILAVYQDDVFMNNEYNEY